MSRTRPTTLTAPVSLTTRASTISSAMRRRRRSVSSKPGDQAFLSVLCVLSFAAFRLSHSSQDGVPKPLLPPIAPEHVGRKCLVLDLDETLVHSSFKAGPTFILSLLPLTDLV